MANVLVIGSGGAGLCAAISARRAGADVAVISKTAAEHASCTAYSAGIFSLPCCGVSAGEQYEKLLETGRGLNDQALLRTLTEESASALEEIASWGVTLKFSKGRASARATAKNPLMGGSGMTRQLVDIAKALGVKFIEWTAARRIHVFKGRACGVSAADWRSGRNFYLSADAVVLATGGAGKIYSHSDNPERMTGDGYALALEAGLGLRDMEFVQFYPMGWAQEGFPKWMVDVTLGDYVRITDAAGKEFLKDAYREWGVKDGKECNYFARDKLSVLLAQKEREGVFAHMEEVPESLWNDRGFLYAAALPKKFFEGLSRPLRIAPLEHYFCGGVEIAANAETALDGLCACGEVTGGIDGANRMGGNALTHAFTFGLKAGRSAAAHPHETPKNFAADDEENFSDREGRPVLEVRRELQQKAWRAIGPIRETGAIRDFLSYIKALKKEKIKAENGYERLLALEMKGLTASAEAVAQAALKRKESIGAHYIVC